MSNQSKQMDLAVLVGLLKQSTKIGRFSSSITVISLLLLTIVMFLFADSLIMVSLSIAIFLLGIVEKYFAVRVDFDRSLLKSLQAYSNSELMSALKSMDHSLCQFGLIKKGYDPERSLESRMKGAIGLFKKQLFCCVIQSILLVSSVIVMISC